MTNPIRFYRRRIQMRFHPPLSKDPGRLILCKTIGNQEIPSTGGIVTLRYLSISASGTGISRTGLLSVCRRIAPCILLRLLLSLLCLLLSFLRCQSGLLCAVSSILFLQCLTQQRIESQTACC